MDGRVIFRTVRSARRVDSQPSSSLGDCSQTPQASSRQSFGGAALHVRDVGGRIVNVAIFPVAGDDRFRRFAEGSWTSNSRPGLSPWLGTTPATASRPRMAMTPSNSIRVNPVFPRHRNRGRAAAGGQWLPSFCNAMALVSVDWREPYLPARCRRKVQSSEANPPALGRSDRERSASRPTNSARPFGEMVFNNRDVKP